MTVPTNAQWKRVAQLIVGRAGAGILIENLRIKFEITKTSESTPNSALIKIYNLNPSHAALIKDEYDEVILNAGYLGHTLLLFRGNIRHVFQYPDKSDHVTEIDAGDGDRDYRTATMNLTLAAGTSNAHLVNKAVASFASTTSSAAMPGSSAAHRIRGKVLSGNTRDILTDMAHELGASWSIQDGALTVVQADAVLAGQAITINSDTGLLTTPEINDKGISVKCLLNPLLKIHGAIHLDNKNIKERHKKLKMLGSANKAKKLVVTPVSLDPDGIYKVIRLMHTGDTRGTGPDWVTELACVGINAPIPLKKEASAYGQEAQQPIE